MQRPTHAWMVVILWRCRMSNQNISWIKLKHNMNTGMIFLCHQKLFLPQVYCMQTSIWLFFWLGQNSSLRLGVRCCLHILHLTLLSNKSINLTLNQTWSYHQSCFCRHAFSLAMSSPETPVFPFSTQDVRQESWCITMLCIDTATVEWIGSCGQLLAGP